MEKIKEFKFFKNVKLSSFNKLHFNNNWYRSVHFLGIHFEHYTNRGLLWKNTVSFQVWVSIRKGCTIKKKMKEEEEAGATTFAVEVG